MDPKARLAVTVTALPNNRMVAALSTLVAEFCRGLVSESEIVFNFHMAAQELAENLMKYSIGRDVTLDAALLSQGDETVLRLSAKNRSTRAQLDVVERRLAALMHAEDPIAHYDRLVRETASQDEGSGLGLARLRAEGDLNVDYAIEGDELTISVHALVRPRKGLP